MVLFNRSSLRFLSGIIALMFSINCGNLLDPEIISLLPARSFTGGAGFQLEVNGNNFTTDSELQWNGTPRATTYVSPTLITAAITEADLAASGTATIEVLSVAANIKSIAKNYTINTILAFVTNNNPDTINSFTINAKTGALAAVSGSPLATGTTPSEVTVDSFGKFAYVANSNSNNVSAYTINKNTGALTAITGSPFAAGTAPLSVIVDPLGRFAYVGNSASNNISAYNINAATGALTAIGSPVAAGTGPADVAIDPTGKFLFVANATSNNVSVYAINQIAGPLLAGALTPITNSTFIAGTGPTSLTMHPLGQFLYVANKTSNNVSAFAINQVTAALTAIGSPIAAGTSPSWSAVDPKARFLYVANNGSNNISGYKINMTTGALTVIPGSPFSSWPSGPISPPISVSVDPSSQFLYVANANSSLTHFGIDQTTGALTHLASSPFLLSATPSSVVTIAAQQ